MHTQHVDVRPTSWHVDDLWFETCTLHDMARGRPVAWHVYIARHDTCMTCGLTSVYYTPRHVDDPWCAEWTTDWEMQADTKT